MINMTYVWKDWSPDDRRPADEITEAMIVNERVAEIRAIQELSGYAVKLNTAGTTHPMYGYKQPGKILQIVQPGKAEQNFQITDYSLSGRRTGSGQLQVRETIGLRGYHGDYD